MRHWQWLWFVVLCYAFGGSLHAAPPASGSNGDPAGMRREQAASYISFVEPRPTARTPSRILVVNYPWHVHDQPSIEVRLVTSGQADLDEVKPLYFVAEYFQGDTLLKVYRGLDEAAKTGVTIPLEEKGIEQQILGRRNSLGKPSVCVARHVPADDPAPGAGVVFCLLPSWSVNQRLLYLELPPQYFAKSGKLYVWFLRHEKVLWQETANWPGYAMPDNPTPETNAGTK